MGSSQDGIVVASWKQQAPWTKRLPHIHKEGDCVGLPGSHEIPKERSRAISRLRSRTAAARVDNVNTNAEASKGSHDPKIPMWRSRQDKGRCGGRSFHIDLKQLRTSSLVCETCVGFERRGV